MNGHDIRGLVLIKGNPEVKILGPVEVVRSFSYKHALLNPDGSKTYESVDFFCSHKAQCMSEDREEVSSDLEEFCMEQVLESLVEFKSRRARKQAAKAQRSVA